MSRLAPIFVLLLLLAGAPAAAQSATPIAAPTIDAWVDVAPTDRAAVRQEVADSLHHYRIDAVFDPERATIAADAAVLFRNTTTVALSEIYFRLFPNAAYYGDGALDIGPMLANGQPAATTLEVDGTALRVDLPELAQPGDAVALAFSFTTTVPADSSGSFGIFNHDTRAGTWVLSDWHPVLAVYDEGFGWNIPPPTDAGDPTYAASALFDVRLTAPAEMTAVASGVVVEKATQHGMTTRRFIAGPAREFTMLVDDDATSVQAARDGVTVVVHTQSGGVSADIATDVAEMAADMLVRFGERFGPYPFTELDLAEADLDGAYAVAWSGIIFLDRSLMFGGLASGDRVAFETVLAHEISHLWWGAMVGSDSNTHAFINEGLATVSSLGYLRWSEQDDALVQSLDRWVAGPARSLLAHGDAVVDLPAADGQNAAARSWATYGKGALGFLAIRQALGEEAFWGALGAYARAERFRIATPADLLAAFATASDEPLEPIWREWFEDTALTSEQIAEVTTAFADGT
ncbi:MAG: M1 family metallopeptidase [Thermomicrobiales bacterium]|nr:M1 family metallopeptidase [Thermomicrobiales bacterium]